MKKTRMKLYIVWECEKIYSANAHCMRNFNEMDEEEEEWGREHSFQLHTCAGVTCMGC